MNEMWPVDRRPHHLQSKDVVKKLSLGKLMKYKEIYEKEAEKQGLGAALYGKDSKPRKTRFKSGTDDGHTRLHKARFCRLPLSAPKKYFKNMPKRRDEISRHFPLEHYGAENTVSEQTIVRMHDRQVPVELDAFVRSGYLKGGELCHVWVQLGLLNYATLMHAIWPMDYTPLVLMRVLAECKWGEAAGGDRKSQMELVKKFFNDVSKENSGRAVRGEAPLDYAQCRARWTKTLESLYPQLAILGGGAKAAAPAAGAGGAAGSGRQQSGGKGAARTAGAASGGGSGAGNGGGLRTPQARSNGLLVCYSYNQAEGCSRDKQGPNACKDKNGNVYAHCCNWWDVRAGKHCLKQHPRTGTH
jgi:hypothetical protein